MFGFVRPCEDKLSKQEKEIFRSYYCGVCKSIAERYTHMARFTLTYDCTFLAMFLTAVKESRAETKNTMCVLRRRNVAISHIVDYCADVNLMLAYYKLDDDVNDDNSIKAKMARVIFKRAFNKAKKKNPKIDMLIKSNLEYLYLLEKDKCNEPDLAADAFGRLLEGIAGMGCDMDKNAMGVCYNLGKYIYLLDAYFDYEKDVKSGSYNVFYCKYGSEENLIEKISFLLECTLSEMVKHYKKIEIKMNKEILDNILYLGIIEPLLKKDNSGEREGK